MKAAVVYEVGKPVQIEDLEMPVISDDDVLIKVVACGVCFSDLKVLRGAKLSSVPALIGHEVSGVIEQVGRTQKGIFKEGDPVIVGMRYKCGRCRYCLAGRDNLCRNRPSPPPLKTKQGTVINRWNVGGFAQYLAVPGYMVFGLPEGLPLKEASVIGCRVTTAYNGVKHGAELEPGESALVMGCGGIGLNTIQFLKVFGAYPIIAVDVLEQKLEAAVKFGASHTINSSKEDPVKTAKQISEGGVDKAFEAIGNPATVDLAIKATRPGGTAVMIGVLDSRPLTISDGSFAFNEIKVTGVASRRANDVIDVLRMVKNRQINVQNLITREYPCEDINQAFEDLEKGRNLMGITLWN